MAEGVARKTVADYPDLAAQWHPTRNGAVKPDEIVAGSNKKFWWKCPVAPDHEWQTSPNTRICMGTNCPCCAGHKLVPSTSLAVRFPELAAQWHPTLNGELTPQDVLAGTARRVWWKCPVADDHEWESTISNRIWLETGCPCCAGKKVVPSNCLETLYPWMAAQWHPTKNGEFTPRTVYARGRRRCCWQCSVADDHEWETCASDRLKRDSGCPCCAGKKVVLSNCLATTHPDIAAEWHPSKNGKLTPFDLVAGSMTKVWWKCSVVDDHVWRVHPGSRTSHWMTGCPKCRLSKGERKIAEYLAQHRIPHKSQWGQGKGDLPRGYAFDFAVNRKHTFWLIEFHGQQHYCPISFGSKKERAKYRGFVNAVRRDVVKERWCCGRQKSLLVIPYWDFDRTTEILDAFFAGDEPMFSEPPDNVLRYEPMRQKIRDRLAATG